MTPTSNPDDGLIERLSHIKGDYECATYRALSAGQATPEQQRAAAAGIVLACALEAEAKAALSRLTRDVEEVDVECEAARIVAENIDQWGWGPLEDIEDLSEHRLALAAAEAGYRAALTRLSRPTDLGADRAGREPSLASRLGPSGDHHGERKDAE